ncbi:MAG: metal-dependent hydrolase [Alphaproteobacteria bacterium]|nr:metal-dependent hydrolase [Alphaproteobacteria bacterium]
MDPLTQGTLGGALGAALPQATRAKSNIVIAGALGFFSGMAADLDVFIRSSSDPLLFLEYHRQFTHSLIFIPVGGLIMALVLHFLLGRRWKLSFLQTALFCTMGYATHALLDSATSYGTMLFWPFSDARIAWRIVSVVDPLFTLPLAGLALAAALKRKPVLAKAGLVWAAAYLALGAMQHQNALQMGRDIAAGRGHTPDRMEVKPSFGNIVVWKTLYEANGRYYVDAVRAGLAPRTFPGSSLPKLDLAADLPWLTPETQQARDIERFRTFSRDYIAQDPARPGRIIDVRYSMVPNQIAALWSIEVISSAGQNKHAKFRTHRSDAAWAMGRLWRMILAKGPRK